MAVPRQMIGPAACLVALVTGGARAHADVGVGAAADVLGGVEGGASGHAAGARRSRTMLRLGLDGWLTAAPSSRLGIAALVEVEPVVSLGGDVRYL